MEPEIRREDVSKKLTDFSRDLQTAWANGNAAAIKISCGKLKQLLNGIEKIVKNDLWRNL